MADRTFSHNDVLRIYCNHLTDFEKDKVREWFEDTGGDCFDLPDIEIDLDDLLDVLDEILDTGLKGAEVLRTLGVFIAGLILGGDDEAIGETTDDIETIVTEGLKGKNVQCLNEVDQEINEQIGMMISRYRDELGISVSDELKLRQEWEATRQKWFAESEKIFDGLYTWNTIVPESWESDVSQWKVNYEQAVSSMFFVLEEAAVTAQNIKAAINGKQEE